MPPFRLGKDFLNHVSSFYFLHDIQVYSLYQLRFHFRFLWFILFSFAIFYGYLLYTPFLHTWHNEPTVIATDQADFPVEKLPFPAITICSNNKIVYRQLESVLRTQPWKALKDFNYNITQETTDKGMYRRSSLYTNFVSLAVCISQIFT